MSSLPDLEIPGYDIIEPIGRGGMASVYRARQHTFDRNVALKILKPDLSEDDAFCQRFVMESLIVAKLNHSHIVQVYDVGEIKNHFYIAMEFLSGGDLNKRLKTGISVPESLTVIKQIASALDFAHKKNIIHRDLKPDNVMFREDEASVLTDFGIAKETDADVNLTQTGLIVGTPKYMAPEQIRGSDPSPEGDIYSLGIMFFQLLCNRVPFHGKDLVATAYQHFNEPVPQLPPHLSQFQELIENMLAKNIEDRISRGKDVAKEIERIEKSYPPESYEQNDETIILQKDNANSDDQTVLSASPTSNDDATKVYQGSPTPDASAPTVLSSPSTEPTTLSEPANTQPPSSPEPESTPTNYAHDETSRTQTRPQISDKKPLFAAAVALIAVVVAIFSFVEPSSDEETPTPQLPAVSDETAKQITELLLGALTDIENNRLRSGESNALSKYEKILILSPGNPQALAGKQRIAKKYASLARQAIDRKNFGRAQEYLDNARDIDPNLDISAVQNRLDAAARDQKDPISTLAKVQISGLLENAKIFEQEGKVFSPAGENAYENYKKVLAIDPYNAAAKRKIEELDKRKP